MRYLPDDIAARINTQNQTIHNNANPSMDVLVARAKNSIQDSDYWTVEEIREGTNLGDVSVAPRRSISSGPPNRLYEIHVDDGEVKTSIREYPDKLRAGWTDQFSLGLGSSVSVAFNGYWERYRKLWRLITEEKPFITWVDNNSVLWVQKWDDSDSKLQLDMGVDKVKAIRGWKNVNRTGQDHGVVVAYIKTDGTVWYKTYAQQTTMDDVWEEARQLTAFNGSAVAINLFITNDYRMGFILEDSVGDIHWFVTGRNWAGMALQSHKISIKASSTVNFIDIKYIKAYTTELITINATATTSFLYAGTVNEIETINNIDNGAGDWGRLIDITVKHDFCTSPTVTVYDTVNDIYLPISTVTLSDQKTLRLEIDSASEVGLNNSESIKVTIQGGTNQAGGTFGPFDETFDPVNLVPVDIPLPILEEVWNE
jgi:hypothetical protein